MPYNTWVKAGAATLAHVQRVSASSALIKVLKHSRKMALNGLISARRSHFFEICLIAASRNTTLALFIGIFPANTTHQFSLHRINVATHFSVVPGNTRWNLAVIEFDKIGEHAPSSSKEWIQHKKERPEEKTVL